MIMEKLSNVRNVLVKLLVMLVSAILTAGASAEDEAAVLNGIAAVVNGRVITKNEVAFLLAPELARLEKRFPNRGPEFEKLLAESFESVLQEVIDQQKLIDQFNQPKIQLPADAVENEVKRVIREDYEGDADKFHNALRANRMTVDGFRTLLSDSLVAREIKLREAKKKQ